MSQFSLSWGIGVGGNCRGGTRKYPEWSDVDTLLDQLQTNCGSVTISIVDGPEMGPQSLQVFSDCGNYLLMLGEDDGDDYNVRSLTNPHAQPGRIEILGDFWDPKMVCTDFNIVRRAFKEFFDKGDVSHDLLD